MANLKVGTGITFDGATGNINAVGVITSGGFTHDGNIGINTNSIVTILPPPPTPPRVEVSV